MNNHESHELHEKGEVNVGHTSFVYLVTFVVYSFQGEFELIKFFEGGSWHFLMLYAFAIVLHGKFGNRTIEGSTGYATKA